MSVGVILAITATLVGLGGTAASLIAWGRARNRYTPSRPNGASLPPGQSRYRISSRPTIFIATTVAIIAAGAVALISPALISPARNGTPKPSFPPSSGAHSGHIFAVLRDPNATGTESLAFSADGSSLATGDFSGSTYLWDLAMLRISASLRNAGGQSVTSVAFSPNGSILAIGSSNGYTYLWRQKTGSPIGELRCGGANGIYALAFSSNGELATGSSASTGKTCLWSVETDKLLATLSSPGGVSSVAFSPDGKLIATGSSGGTISIWDILTDRLILVMSVTTSSSSGVSSLAFSPDGKLLAIGALNGKTYLAAVATLRFISSLANSSGQAVTSMAFSPDGTILVIGYVQSKALVWNMALRKVIEDLVDPGGQGVSSVAVSPDGKTIATADLNGSTYLWRLSPSLAAPEQEGYQLLEARSLMLVSCERGSFTGSAVRY
jgi:WD40 repeat protein